MMATMKLSMYILTPALLLVMPCRRRRCDVFVYPPIPPSQITHTHRSMSPTLIILKMLRKSSFHLNIVQPPVLVARPLFHTLMEHLRLGNDGT
ncbi:hypothetical protein EJ04DRAFT_235961 [Polyplosphaeria fusca]|uniref:Secreted protein n=1 Tax=Polyplosphaeria fusca TaxID=682080 RepID=A0A9P4V965_9PLEO|nr:hypothetical protein EJ04DRAFT_235961 [Polyplosphaeria fusca]